MKTACGLIIDIICAHFLFVCLFVVVLFCFKPVVRHVGKTLFMFLVSYVSEWTKVSE